MKTAARERRGTETAKAIKSQDALSSPNRPLYRNCPGTASKIPPAAAGTRASRTASFRRALSPLRPPGKTEAFHTPGALTAAATRQTAVSQRANSAQPEGSAFPYQTAPSKKLPPAASTVTRPGMAFPAAEAADSSGLRPFPIPAGNIFFLLRTSIRIRNARERAAPAPSPFTAPSA